MRARPPRHINDNGLRKIIILRARREISAHHNVVREAIQVVYSDAPSSPPRFAFPPAEYLPPKPLGQVQESLVQDPLGVGDGLGPPQASVQRRKDTRYRLGCRQSPQFSKDVF